MASSPCDCGVPMLGVGWVVALAVILVVGSAVAAAITRRRLRPDAAVDDSDATATQVERL